uniref:Uncharacterized protein n=1 Tax=Arundo donax TaxID=35708 RepID=A0A0A9BAB6_ARUDO
MKSKSKGSISKSKHNEDQAFSNEVFAKLSVRKQAKSS